MSQAVLKYTLVPEAKASGLVLKVPRELDAGFDLPSLEDVSISIGKSALLRTGVHLGIPAGWVGLIRDRSSVALRGGVTAAGVIDASYRGEVKILIYNFSGAVLEIKKGERIAQCLVIPHLPGTASAEVESIEDLGETERGVGGFGSTGR